LLWSGLRETIIKPKATPRGQINTRQILGKLNIALAHDDLIQAGGAERVVAVMHDMFPEAPIYTSIYDKKNTLDDFASADIRTSYLQNTLLGNKRFHQFALGSFPAAFESFDFSEYDIVLSSSSRFAKGIITPPHTCHICYCHSPARFAWRFQDYLNQNKLVRLMAPFFRSTISDLRTWDAASAVRVDYFIANSQNVAERIRKYYRREVAAIIYPPIDTKRFLRASKDDAGDYYLCVSRLVGHKRLDIVIEACNRLAAPLHIVGVGEAEDALRALAGPTIHFLGSLPSQDVALEYARCKAFIFPGDEDFGMTPVEAMASGRPVAAYASGGALETIVDGKTGIFFNEQSVDSLLIALDKLDQVTFYPEELQMHASYFDTAHFNDQILKFISKAVDDHRKSMSGRRRMLAPAFFEEKSALAL